MSCRYSGMNCLGYRLFPGTWDQPPHLPARGRRVPPLALKDWFLPLCISFSCPPGLPVLRVPISASVGNLQAGQQDAEWDN